MEANEAQELQEHAEHAQESVMRPVAFTMSVLAVLVAVTTVMGHRVHTEAVVNQIQAADQWNEYQFKKIRSYNTGLESQLLGAVSLADKDKAAKDLKDNADHQAKWTPEFKEEQEKAEALEKKVEIAEARANRYDLGETLLEIGLVITSVTLLTRSRVYWYFGMACGAAGVVSALTALLVH